MKRGMLILLFILLLACSVSAMTVSIYPSSGIVHYNTDQVTVSCRGFPNETETVSNYTVYYKNNRTDEYAREWGPGGFEEYDGEVEFDLIDLVNGTYELNCLVMSNDSIPRWADSNFTFEIAFTLPTENNAPSCTVATDTNKTTDEDTGVDIDSDMGASGGIYCTDEDEDTLTYDVSTQSGAGTFSITGNNLSAYPEANATGGGYATISVTDGTDTVYFDVNVTWTAVNDAPYLSEIIPNQTWDENTDEEIDLDDYFSDPDGDSLTYNYTFTDSDPDINVTIDENGEATFTPDTDWTGTEKLTFTAYDTANASVTSNEVILTVEEANDTTNNAPSIDSYLPESDPTISVDESQTFTITKSDPNGDSMNVTWYVDNAIQEGETSDSFVYTASSTGSFKIKVAISDGSSSDVKTWILTVKSAEAKTTTAAHPSGEETEEETYVCGDDICDPGEDCIACPADCGCPSGYTCSPETKKCRKEKKSGNIILLVVIISLFAGGAGAGIYFYKKKQEKEIFGLAKTPFRAPAKEEVKKEAVKVKEEVKPKEPVVKTAKKPLKTVKTTNQVLLKKYIIYNLRKGKSFNQIKKELLKVGWKEEQIQDAYTAAQLDETFS